MRQNQNSARINNLADELLSHILSFLPTTDVVKSRVLSNRWKYLFTLTRNLYFDDKEGFGATDRCVARKMMFERFVYGGLSLHQMSPIHKFSLKYGSTCDSDRSHPLAWIAAAILKGVQHLVLSIYHLSNALPSCIFNCQTLTVLDIYTNGYDLAVPSSVYLPSLKTLKLFYIRFLDGDSVNRFFVGCSQLKELNLVHCEFTTDRVHVLSRVLQKVTIFGCKGHVVIDSPNLASLSYVCTSPSTTVDVKNLRSLLEVELCPLSMFEPPRPMHDIIKGAINVRELILDYNTMKVKLFTAAEDNPIPIYSKLERLLLGNCFRDTWKYLMVWLANSPRLETIVFRMGLIVEDDMEHEGLIEENDTEHELHPRLELAPFSSNVKIIKVREFRGHKLELLLLKYLLENAGALQRLILHNDGTMQMKQELQVREELRLLPKASANCRIELK